jgi:hypothetical protein
LGETLGPAGFIGAACIGSSVYTVAMMNNKWTLFDLYVWSNGQLRHMTSPTEFL